MCFWGTEICNGQYDDWLVQLTIGGIPNSEYDDDGDGFGNAFQPFPSRSGLKFQDGEYVDSDGFAHGWRLQ